MVNSNDIMNAFGLTKNYNMAGFLNKYHLKYVKSGDTYYVTDDSFNHFLNGHKLLKKAWKIYKDYHQE